MAFLCWIIKLGFCFTFPSLKAPLEHSSEMSLSDSGFEPGGKKNFLQLVDKDGEQPQIASVRGLKQSNCLMVFLFHLFI